MTLAIVITACALLLLGIIWLNGRIRPDTGLQNGALKPCPDSPNCVCSQADDELHGIAPLSFAGDPTDALHKLRKVTLSLPRSRLVTSSSNYLHFEFRSSLLQFVDDVEFLLTPDSQIHVRSASRVGVSDLGVNRARIERIRRDFNAQ